jgi:hypothetical protein
MKVAILDDYQNVALEMADWSSVAARAEITVFNDLVADPDAVVERLLPFDVICVMRERTPLPREVLERLPQLTSFGRGEEGSTRKSAMDRRRPSARLRQAHRGS